MSKNHYSKMNDKDKKYNDDLALNHKRLIEEVFKPSHFPNVSYGSTSSMTGAGRFEASTMSLSGFNEVLKGSVIEYKGGYRFLHFTSLENLVNIIRTKSIRLYDLNHLQDPQEYVFGHKHLMKENNKERIKKLKSNLFSLSLIEYDAKTVAENLDLWRLYGLNGKGVCLDISISKINLNKWYTYFIGTMLYRDLEKENEISLLKSKYEDFVLKYDFRITNFDEFVSVLLSFYKTIPYKSENEIRLIKFMDKENLVFDNENSGVELDINSRLQPVTFCKVDLLTEEEVKKMNEMELKVYNFQPHFQLNEILLGYDIENWYEILETISSLSNKNFKYLPKILRSPLSKYFTT